jgi:hypothetical protein
MTDGVGGTGNDVRRARPVVEARRAVGFVIASPPARMQTVVAACPMTIFAEGNGVIRDSSSRLSNEAIPP